jgi:lipopolysaccharide heptosyltransferase II
MASRILVVSVNWLGDVVFSLPFFTALKSAFPDGHIACLAVSRVRPILENAMGLDEIIECPDVFKMGALPEYFRLIHLLRRRRFDKAYFLHRSYSRRLLVLFAGVPQRVGYRHTHKLGALTLAVPSPDIQQIHRADYYLHLLEASGVPVNDRESRLVVTADREKKAWVKIHEEGVDRNSEFLVIHPGGNWNLKRWPVESYVGLMDIVARKFAVQIVLSGADGDCALHERIKARMKSSVGKPIYLAGRLSLEETMVLLKSAKVMVSADSGPLHIANSLGTPVVGIYGPTRPELTGPRGGGRSMILQRDVGCNRRACYHTECPDPVCVKAVTVLEVVDAIEKIFA